MHSMLMVLLALLSLGQGLHPSASKRLERILTEHQIWQQFCALATIDRPINAAALAEHAGHKPKYVRRLLIGWTESGRAKHNSSGFYGDHPERDTFAPLSVLS